MKKYSSTSFNSHFFVHLQESKNQHNMSETTIISINIAQVLKEKVPNTKIPTFLVNYLRRIVHEDELNEFLRKYPGLKNLEFIEATLNDLHVSIKIEGKENLPQGGKYIFVGNHPLGGLDGITTGYIIGKEYDNKIKFFSNDILMNVEPFKEMFVPVNKVGSQSKDYAVKMKELYESDYHLITYPAGMCSRKVKGKIVDLE